MLIAWIGVGSGLLVALISWLSVRATRRSNVDTKAANELAARDREIEARDRIIEARDRFTDQIQEERDRTIAAKDAQIHELLGRLDLLGAQVQALQERNATLRNP